MEDCEKMAESSTIYTKSVESSEKKLSKALFWSLAERVGSQVISLIISTILARLIMPKDYGVLAAVTIFTSLATTFVSGGYGNALIQKKDADDKDIATMFIFNTSISILLYFILYFLAPTIILIFNETYEYELLVKVLRWLGIGVIFSSFNSFYRALLTKKFLFKKVFFVTLIGTIFSACVGIFLAYRGFGVWALVVQNLLSYFINTVCFIIVVHWKPKLYFSFKRLKPMFLYGTKLMISSLLITIYAEITSIVIGNRYNAEELAFYKKGNNYPKLIALNIITAINMALFPVLAEMNTLEEQKALIRKFSGIISFIITPLMLGFAAIGTTFIRLLLTDKWLPCVVFLEISCFNYAIQPFGIASLQYLKASGKATNYLVLDIIRKLISLLLLCVAIYMNCGVELLAIAELLGNFFAIFINFHPGRKFLGYSIKQQLSDVLGKYLLSIIMYICVYCLGYLAISLILKLCLQIVVGISVYVLLAYLFKSKELFWIIGKLKRKRME